MSVLLRKAPSYCEVYNDVDQEVVCFFKVLRERPDELIRAIELTPFSRFELGQAFEPAGDELERARRLYIRSWQGRGGPRAKWRTGWRRQKVATKSNGQKKMTPATRSFMQTDHLMVIAERLRGVEIDCEPALKVIERYDSPVTLFYLDPPYVSSTRNRWKKHAYAHEMTDKQHRQLARAVHDLQGMALISGYRCELYDNLYADWTRVDCEARTNSQYGTATESLWISPAAMDAKLPLFDRHINTH